MTGPDPTEILKAWKPFKKALGVTSVRTEREYARARDNCVLARCRIVEADARIGHVMDKLRELGLRGGRDED